MAHEVAGILAVEDAETRSVADLLGVAPENAMPRRVEGAAVDPAGFAAEEPAHPVEHLASRLIGEGQQQNLSGWDAILDEPAGAVDQGSGLAGSGAGEDQHGSAGMHDRGMLLLVEIVVVVDPTAAAEPPWIRRADAVAHGRARWPRMERSKARLRSRP